MSYYAPQPFAHNYEYPSASPTVLETLRSEHVTLEVRQQPRQALITHPKKERTRKPVDPPVVVQMRVDRRADATQLFLHNPNLFAVANLQYENGETVRGQCLIGSLTSSLHRLKEVDSKDGGFFVFGDISVALIGKFRFCFSIYELRKSEVWFLKTILSDTFEVVSPKDYLGLEESSFLTRAFADQGVRLRLRKEQRSMGGTRPRRDTKSTQDDDDALISPTYKPESTSQRRKLDEDDDRPTKRSKTDFGPMWPGVHHSTRGWGAFTTSDMRGWCRPEEVSMTATTPLLSDHASKVPTSVGYSHALPQLPPLTPQSSAARAFEWRSDSPHDSYQASVFPPGLSSSLPNSSAGAYDGLLTRPLYPQQQAPTFTSPSRPLRDQHSIHSPPYSYPLQSPRQQFDRPSGLFTDSTYSGYDRRQSYDSHGHDIMQSQEVKEGKPDLGLQTLASAASEQQTYLGNPVNNMSGPLEAPSGLQMFSQPLAYDSAETRPLQPPFKSDATAAAAMTWPSMPWVSAGGGSERNLYGDAHR